jgi:hypothetical protein
MTGASLGLGRSGWAKINTAEGCARCLNSWQGGAGVAGAAVTRHVISISLPLHAINLLMHHIR